MTRLLLLLIVCAPLAGCGSDGRSGDSASGTQHSETEPGVTLGGYARVGVTRTF